jgi:Domain of Unknown Function (DUF1080)
MFVLRLPAFLLLVAAAAPAQQGQHWIQLFNGKNLDGWTPKIQGYDLGDNYKSTFRAEHGVLRVVYDGYDKWDNRFGHIFYAKPFSRYIIAVEYRFTGEQVPGGPAWAFRNSGIMIHCQDPKTMTKEQDFPISIEVQLLGGNGSAKRPTANLCTPGTNIVMGGKLVTTHCISSSSETYHGDQWVRVEAEVDGDKVIRHKVNGQTVLTYEQPQIGGGAVNRFDPAAKPDGKLLTQGYISLQSESHPIEFRKVELLDLTAQAK